MTILDPSTGSGQVFRLSIWGIENAEFRIEKKNEGGKGLSDNDMLWYNSLKFGFK